MIKFCLQQWDRNKNALRQKIETDKSVNSCDYKYFVYMVVKYIFNDNELPYTGYDYSKITVINDGNYSGTILFLIPEASYCPSESQYLMTFANYGSCSVCDTLKRIQELSSKDLPTAKQVDLYMILCKDLVCNTIKPYNNGWRGTDEFETVVMQD